MQEQLNQISEQTGVPAELLERSARARATAQGVAVEALVAGWAGGDAPAAPAAAAPAAPAEAPGAGQVPEALMRRSAAAKAKREGRPLEDVLAEMGLAPDGTESEAPAAAPAAPAAATPAAATAPAAEETAPEPEPEEEPEPLLAGFPRWLAAAFVVLPMIALLYAGLAPNGPDCGTSGQLAINPITGEAESCEGGVSPFLSMGETVYESQCVACHSADGSGPIGPSFLDGAVLETFSSCEDHIAWVSLGSNDWPDATYGDNNKPVMGTGVAMAGYQATLSEQEIAAVALYERVTFGGEEIGVAEVSCGLVEGDTSADG
jgi:mono/diheme cytochrome c family protein